MEGPTTNPYLWLLIAAAALVLLGIFACVVWSLCKGAMAIDDEHLDDCGCPNCCLARDLEEDAKRSEKPSYRCICPGCWCIIEPGRVALRDHLGRWECLGCAERRRHARGCGCRACTVAHTLGQIEQLNGDSHGQRWTKNPDRPQGSPPDVRG